MGQLLILLPIAIFTFGFSSNVCVSPVCFLMWEIFQSSTFAASIQTQLLLPDIHFFRQANQEVCLVSCPSNPNGMATRKKTNKFWHLACCLRDWLNLSQEARTFKKEKNQNPVLKALWVSLTKLFCNMAAHILATGRWSAAHVNKELWPQTSCNKSHWSESVGRTTSLLYEFCLGLPHAPFSRKYSIWRSRR